MNILFVFPNIDVPGYKPIGLSSLIAVAKKLGHKVRLFDTSFFDLEELTYNKVFVNTKQAGEEVLNFIPVDLSDYNTSKKKVDLDLIFRKELEVFQPDLVALSIFSQEYGLGMHLLEVVKKTDPGIRTIVGGIHCYADPESVISNPNVDFMCLGEGEQAFKELLGCFESGNGTGNIAGLWVREGLVIKRNPTNGYLDLNRLPFLDYDEYDSRQFLRVFNGKVYKSADISLTRGCFERCIYCLYDKIYEVYNNSCQIRHYDIDRFIAELKYLVQRHNINFIRFQDSSFLGVSNVFLEAFAKEYKQEIGLPFVIDSTPQAVTPERIRCLKEMNCQSISIGIETGNEQFRLKYLNKKATNKVIINAFHTVQKFNIRTVGFILIGFPFETREYIFETIELIRQTRLSSPNLGFVYPFKGSKLREMVLKEGLFDESIEINNTPQYSRDCPMIRNPQITKDEYRGIYRTFLFYCKFPKEYYPDISIAERFDQEGNAMYKKLRELFVEKNLYNEYL